MAERFGVGSVLAYLLLGCSPTSETGPKRAEDILASGAPATEAEKRAARLLSLGNNSSLEAISDPYELSVSCIVSLEWLTERLRDGSLASSEQIGSLDMVGKIYRRQGLDTGRSQTELAKDLEKARADDLDDNQRARLALSCMRRLT